MSPTPSQLSGHDLELFDLHLVHSWCTVVISFVSTVSLSHDCKLCTVCTAHSYLPQDRISHVSQIQLLVYGTNVRTQFSVKLWREIFCETIINLSFIETVREKFVSLYKFSLMGDSFVCPDFCRRRKGSGHSPTLKLSPGRNFDLANQNLWLQMMSWKRFFSRLSVLPTTRCGKSLHCSMFHLSAWGEQWADRQWTYTWCRHWSLINHA